MFRGRCSTMPWRGDVSSQKHDLRDVAARFARKARSDEIALDKLGDDPMSLMTSSAFIRSRPSRSC